MRNEEGCGVSARTELPHVWSVSAVRAQDRDEGGNTSVRLGSECTPMGGRGVRGNGWAGYNGLE